MNTEQLLLVPDAAMTAGASQRWRRRVSAWQLPGRGGFDPSRYRVVELDEPRARHFIEQHHYSRSWPAARLRFGLVDRAPQESDYADPDPAEHLPAGRLVGVAVLGVPMHPRVLTGPFPGLVPYRESLELSRLVLLDPVPANADSVRYCGERINSTSRRLSARRVQPTQRVG